MVCMSSMEATRQRNRRRHLRESGAIIATHRVAENLTRRELASELHVSTSTIRRWETGQSSPYAAQIVTLSILLGVTPSTILGLE